jgi:hypothetical protein
MEPEVTQATLLKDLLVAHHQATRNELIDIKASQIRMEAKLDIHTHRQYPTWNALVTIVIALAGAIVVVG